MRESCVFFGLLLALCIPMACSDKSTEPTTAVTPVDTLAVQDICYVDRVRYDLGRLMSGNTCGEISTTRPTSIGILQNSTSRPIGAVRSIVIKSIGMILITPPRAPNIFRFWDWIKVTILATACPTAWWTVMHSRLSRLADSPFLTATRSIPIRHSLWMKVAIRFTSLIRYRKSI